MTGAGNEEGLGLFHQSECAEHFFLLPCRRTQLFGGEQIDVARQCFDALAIAEQLVACLLYTSRCV